MKNLYIISIAGKEYFFIADLDPSQIEKVDNIVQSFNLGEYNMCCDGCNDKILEEIQENISGKITPIAVSYVFRKKE